VQISWEGVFGRCVVKAIFIYLFFGFCDLLGSFARGVGGVV
jgi:hypothetical protein